MEKKTLDQMEIITCYWQEEENEEEVVEIVLLILLLLIRLNAKTGQYQLLL